MIYSVRTRFFRGWRRSAGANARIARREKRVNVRTSGAITATGVVEQNGGTQVSTTERKWREPMLQGRGDAHAGPDATLRRQTTEKM